MPEAAKTLELFAARRMQQRIAANEKFRARLWGTLRKAGIRDHMDALFEAHKKCLQKELSRNARYSQACSDASKAARAAGLRPPPGLRADVGPEEGVRRATWKIFEKQAAALCEAYGDEARLIMITVTCRDLPDLSWARRMKRVTTRRDRVLESLVQHKVWATSFFDVQAAVKETDDFSPHWHILFVTNADRLHDVVARLDAIRSVAMHVAYCDFEDGNVSARRDTGKHAGGAGSEPSPTAPRRGTPRLG